MSVSNVGGSGAPEFEEVHRVGGGQPIPEPASGGDAPATEPAVSRFPRSGWRDNDALARAVVDAKIAVAEPEPPVAMPETLARLDRMRENPREPGAHDVTASILEDDPAITAHFGRRPIRELAGQILARENVRATTAEIISKFIDAWYAGRGGTTPTIGLEYGVPVGRLPPEPTIGLEYGVPVGRLPPDPTIGLEYGVPVGRLPPAPTIGLEYGVPVGRLPPEPAIGLEYGVPVNRVPTAPPRTPPAPARPQPMPTIGLEYGVPVGRLPPEPTVGLEYGVPVGRVPPEPTIGLEYGVPVGRLPPDPTIGLEYGVPVGRLPPEPTIGLEYGVPVPTRPARSPNP